MKKTLILVLAGSVFAVAACDGTPATDDADGGAGGDAPGTGGSATGGGTTGGSGGIGTGGSTGGTAMGGLGGLGGMGGALSLEEVCATWCAAKAVPGCADDPDEPTCRTNCETGAFPGCEAEWLVWRTCEAPLTFECFSYGDMETAVKADPNQCVDESNAELDCYNSMNPQ